MCLVLCSVFAVLSVLAWCPLDRTPVNVRLQCPTPISSSHCMSDPNTQPDTPLHSTVHTTAISNSNLNLPCPRQIPQYRTGWGADGRAGRLPPRPSRGIPQGGVGADVLAESRGASGRGRGRHLARCYGTHAVLQSTAASARWPSLKASHHDDGAECGATGGPDGPSRPKRRNSSALLRSAQLPLVVRAQNRVA